MNRLLLLSLICTAPLLQAGEVVEYRDGDTLLEGYLAMPTPASDHSKKPAGILIVHDWLGLQQFPRAQADRLAKLGYVAFAADIYGKDVRPASPAEAMVQVKKYKADRPLFRTRMVAALEQLRKSADPDRLVAIGYCFGGTGVLELARSGADLRGVVSFHGGLDAPLPATGPLHPKALALHGADDGYVPQTEVAGFVKEMQELKADWQLVQLGNAVHAFTIPSAGNDPSKGAAYNATADARSWRYFLDFLDEALR